MAAFFLLATSIVVILLCKIATFVYNHYAARKKLSHIPGPTSLPFIGTLGLLNAEEDRMDWLLSQLNKYKDGIFLLWAGMRPLIYLTKPDLIKIVLKSTVYLDKSDHYEFLAKWMGHGLLLSEAKQWIRDRKLLSPTFHSNILERYSMTMCEKTEIMIKRLEKMIAENPGTAINIVPIIDSLALDILFATVVGTDTKSQEEKSNYISYVHRLVQLTAARINQPWFSSDWIFNLSRTGKAYKRTLDKMQKFTKSLIKEKQLEITMQNNESQIDNDIFTMTSKPKKALLELLFAINKYENVFTEEELKGHVDTFMFAGYDTTATSLGWALFCLGNFLEYQEKIHEEIEEVFQDSQEPASIKQLTQMKYLERFMKESIRLFPTIPVIGRKIMEDIDLGGYTIPRGSSVSMSIMLLHRDPTIWPDPLKFDPDRFLLENIRSQHPYAFIPFSAGPRNCIGMRFALLEEKIVLTAILRKWRLKCVQKPEDVTIHDSTVIRPISGMINLHFTPKK